MRKIFLGFFFAIFCTLGALAQTVITGQVTDANGKALANASVTILGSKSAAALTGNDGSFRISVPANAKALVFSYTGMESVTESINGRNSISVTLHLKQSDLSEVVVTGITRVRKSQYAGAATKIDDKQLKDKPVGSFDQILQGRAPGVTTLTSSGQPGTASTVIIRGQGSIQGGTDPLYVVDGIPIEAAAFQGLNPNDFLSVDILRDASATALYGSRGSAGVIVITTKRGTAGKLKLSYAGQMGIKSKPDFAFRPMNTTELLKAQEAYGKIVGSSASTTTLPGWYYSTENPRYATLTPAQQAAEAHIYDSIQSINTNWYDEIFRNGTFSNHEIRLSGGTGKTRFNSSIALYNEQGTTLRTDMKRVTSLTGLDYADDKFTYGLTLSLGYSKRDFQQSATSNNLGNPFLFSVVNVPYTRAKNDDGSWAVGPTGSPTFSAANSLDLTSKDINSNNQFKGILSMNLNYKIMDYLSIGLNTGADFRETQNTNYGAKDAWVRINSTSITGKAGFQAEGLSRNFIGTVRPNLTFHKIFQDKHDLDVSVYGEYVTSVFKSFNFTGYGTDPKRPNTPAATTQGNAVNQLYSVVGGGRSRSSILSGLALLRYTYNGKYTLTGSFRRDGSSKLPSETRWQSFWSVGGIWDATKEKFLESSNFVNVLRVKLSYGGSGNADNFPGGDYPYQAQYSQGSYSGLQTIIALTPGNPELKWETTWVTNLGIDFELWKRRIYGDVNLYNKVTKDLFVQKTLSAVSGFGSIDQNLGKLGNKGVELNLNVDVVRNNKITWTVFGNLGYNKNEVLSLGGEPPYEVGTELITKGKPLGTHYEVAWAGVDAATGKPLYYDINGNVTDVYSSDNRVQTFGTWDAPWKGGFGTRVSYKGFDLSTLFSWQKGATKVDNMEYFMENPVGFLANGYNQSSDLVFWQKPGDIVNTPSPLYGVNFSSKIIHNADFLRLRDVTLAYTLPRATLAKTKVISNARIYVQGSNLFIWTKWRGPDPEAGSVNINLSEYPNPRAFTAGIEVTF